MNEEMLLSITDELELAGASAVRRLFSLVRRRFCELERTQGFTQKQLAERMELKPAQISRWMSSPSNMTVRTAAKLLCAMDCKLELCVSVSVIEPSLNAD